MKLKSKKIRFASRDALPLQGTIAVPAGQVTGLLLMVHGITSDRSEWGIFDLVAEELGKEGIASLRFDYRGHGENSLSQDQITLSGIQSDVISAWNDLEERVAGDDKKRVGRYIMGSSFGGGVAYAAASAIGSIDRLFLLAPVFNYLADIDHCAPKWLSDLKRGDNFKYNDLRLGRALANEAFYFDPLAGEPVPTTIFHGTEDTDVSIDLSRKAAAKRVNLELVEMKGAGHVLNAPDDYDLDDEASWEFVRSMIKQVRKKIR